MNEVLKDHLGNSFSSIQEMASFYNVSYLALYKRLKREWSIEEALTTPFSSCEQNKIKDHLGKVHKNIEEMCKAHNITLGVYKDRKNQGWPLKKILTTPIRNSTCKDHLGNFYTSQEAMAKAYNLNLTTLCYRLKAGWSLKDALTKPLGSRKPYFFAEDGNSFYSLTEAAKFYGVQSYKLCENFNKFKDFKLALKHTLDFYNKKKLPQVFDHLGNEFFSEKEMAFFWNMSPQTFYFRKKNWKDKSLEEILETPVKVYKNYNGVKDVLGNSFPNLAELCTFWNIPRTYFLRRLASGWSFEDALTIPVKDKASYGEFAVKEYLELKNVEYVQNKLIRSVFSYEDFKNLYFDFYIPSIRGIIEFDGEQHFSLWSLQTEEGYQKAKIRDDLKTSLCKKYKIPLLRIRYDQKDKIKELVADFLQNPDFYIKRNNKFLTNKKYWEIRE